MYDPVTELEHYGVLGMKWGVRKDRSRGSGGVSRSSTSISKRVKGKIADRREKSLEKYKKKEMQNLDLRLRKGQITSKAYEKESKVLSSMSYKDMKSEKKLATSKKFSKRKREAGRIVANTALRQVALMELSKISFSGMQHPALTRRKQMGATAANAALTAYEFIRLKDLD